MAHLGTITSNVTKVYLPVVTGVALLANGSHHTHVAPAVLIKPEDGDAVIVTLPTFVATVKNSTRKVLSGQVKEYGVGVSRMVRAYRRDNGVMLGQTTSNGSGYFSIAILGFTGETYVIAFDDNLEPALNAQILDKVIPL